MKMANSNPTKQLCKFSARRQLFERRVGDLSSENHRPSLAGFCDVTDDPATELIWFVADEKLFVYSAALNCSYTSADYERASWAFEEGSQICCVKSYWMTDEYPGLLVCYQRGGKSYLALFDIGHSVVQCTIQLDYEVTSVTPILSKPSENAEDKLFLAPIYGRCEGLCVVGTKQSHLFAIDISMVDDRSLFAKSPMEATELQICSMRSKHALHPHRARHHCVDLLERVRIGRGDSVRIAQPLEDSRFGEPENVDITVLAFNRSSSLLAAGTNCGLTLLFSMYTNGVLAEIQSAKSWGAVHLIAWQEPDNDPRPTLYLWTANESYSFYDEHDDQQSDPITGDACAQLNAITFKTKGKHPYIGAYYSDFEGTAPRLCWAPPRIIDWLNVRALTAPASVMPAIDSNASMISDGDQSSSSGDTRDGTAVLNATMGMVATSTMNTNRIMFAWLAHADTEDSPPEVGMAVFDANAWYGCRLPSQIRFNQITKLSPFMSMIDVVQSTIPDMDCPFGESVLDMKIEPVCGMRRFTSPLSDNQDALEAPSSLGWRATAVTSLAQIVCFRTRALQNEVLDWLRTPAIFVRQFESPSTSLCSRLITSSLVPANKLNTLDDQRLALLSVLLGHVSYHDLVPSLYALINTNSDHITKLPTFLEKIYDVVQQKINENVAVLFGDLGVALNRTDKAQAEEGIAVISTIIRVLRLLEDKPKDVETISAMTLVLECMHSYYSVLLWLYKSNVLPASHYNGNIGDVSCHLFVDELVHHIYSASPDNHEIWNTTPDKWYPPDDIERLLALYQLPNVDTHIKHAIIAYFLLDYHQSDYNEFEHFTNRFLSKPVNGVHWDKFVWCHWNADCGVQGDDTDSDYSSWCAMMNIPVAEAVRQFDKQQITTQKVVTNPYTKLGPTATFDQRLEAVLAGQMKITELMLYPAITAVQERALIDAMYQRNNGQLLHVLYLIITYQFDKLPDKLSMFPRKPSRRDQCIRDLWQHCLAFKSSTPVQRPYPPIGQLEIERVNEMLRNVTQAPVEQPTRPVKSMRAPLPIRQGTPAPMRVFRSGQNAMTPRAAMKRRLHQITGNSRPAKPSDVESPKPMLSDGAECKPEPTSTHTPNKNRTSVGSPDDPTCSFMNGVDNSEMWQQGNAMFEQECQQAENDKLLDLESASAKRTKVDDWKNLPYGLATQKEINRRLSTGQGMQRSDFLKYTPKPFGRRHSVIMERMLLSTIQRNEPSRLGTTVTPSSILKHRPLRSAVDAAESHDTTEVKHLRFDLPEDDESDSSIKPMHPHYPKEGSPLSVSPNRSRSPSPAPSSSTQRSQHQQVVTSPTGGYLSDDVSMLEEDDDDDDVPHDAEQNRFVQTTASNIQYDHDDDTQNTTDDSSVEQSSTEQPVRSPKQVVAEEEEEEFFEATEEEQSSVDDDDEERKADGSSADESDGPKESISYLNVIYPPMTPTKRARTSFEIVSRESKSPTENAAGVSDSSTPEKIESYMKIEQLRDESGTVIESNVTASEQITRTDERTGERSTSRQEMHITESPPAEEQADVSMRRSSRLTAVRSPVKQMPSAPMITKSPVQAAAVVDETVTDEKSDEPEDVDDQMDAESDVVMDTSVEQQVDDEPDADKDAGSRDASFSLHMEVEDESSREVPTRSKSTTPVPDTPKKSVSPTKPAPSPSLDIESRGLDASLSKSIASASPTPKATDSLTVSGCQSASDLPSPVKSPKLTSQMKEDAKIITALPPVARRTRSRMSSISMADVQESNSAIDRQSPEAMTRPRRTSSRLSNRSATPPSVAGRTQTPTEMTTTAKRTRRTSRRISELVSVSGDAVSDTPGKYNLRPRGASVEPSTAPKPDNQRSIIRRAFSEAPQTSPRRSGTRPRTQKTGSAVSADTSPASSTTTTPRRRSARLLDTRTPQPQSAALTLPVLAEETVDVKQNVSVSSSSSFTRSTRLQVGRRGARMRPPPDAPTVASEAKKVNKTASGGSALKTVGRSPMASRTPSPSATQVGSTKMTPSSAQLRPPQHPTSSTSSTSKTASPTKRHQQVPKRLANLKQTPPAPRSPAVQHATRIKSKYTPKSSAKKTATPTAARKTLATPGRTPIRQSTRINKKSPKKATPKKSVSSSADDDQTITMVGQSTSGANVFSPKHSHTFNQAFNKLVTAPPPPALTTDDDTTLIGDKPPSPPKTRGLRAGRKTRATTGK